MIEKIESDLHRDAVTERKDTHAPDLEIKTSCTLKEFFMGCTKKLNFSKTITLGDGKTTESSVTQKDVEIKPGMKPGTKFRFEGEGNKFPNQLVGDLIVVIGQHEHDSIKRVGDDLIYRHKISLSNALTAKEVEFTTLEGELIKYRPDQIITPEFQNVFPGKGMPIYKDDPLSPLMMDHERGNFILKFQIEFPNSLPDSKKEKLVSVLQEAM